MLVGMFLVSAQDLCVGSVGMSSVPLYLLVLVSFASDGFSKSFFGFSFDMLAVPDI